jgi:hypothetical protein
MTKPLSLSDRQMRLLQTAAKAVPLRQRSEFLEKVANHLGGPEVSDAAVQAALNAQLDRLPVFLTDSAPAPSKQIKGTTNENKITANR